MKGFTSILSSPSVSVGDPFLLKKWKTTDTGTLRAGKPSSMTLSFINNRSRIKTLRDDGLTAPSHMATTAGFTLIELLVVVLIIGILSAVALPQYQTVVARTRYQQLVVMANNIAKAEDAYFMANGQYTTDFSALDFDFGNSTPLQGDAGTYNAISIGKGFACVLRDYAVGTVQCKSDYYTDVPEFQINFDSHTRMCHNYHWRGSVAQRVCRLETNTQAPARTNSEYETYLYK
ncbi:type IV pilin protein [Candidatus Avelusimicrobium sp.]|uniref:type IV pilin protein n=1 Tax=Candidatus Avelusimicrobium sp. TaxID=3048833 RepID=UPI003D7D060E